MNSPTLLARSLTRRQSIPGLAMTIGSLAFASTNAHAAQDDGTSHAAATIHQETTIAATPTRVYEALLDAKQFQRIELLSGVMPAADLNAKPAEIGRQPGEAFSLFAGYITGRQIDLVPNQRIVQAWRVGDWPAGKYSLAKFEFTADGSRTRLVFDHTGFPTDEAEHLAAGWKANYWEPLSKLLLNP